MADVTYHEVKLTFEELCAARALVARARRDGLTADDDARACRGADRKLAYAVTDAAIERSGRG